MNRHSTLHPFVPVVRALLILTLLALLPSLAPQTAAHGLTAAPAAPPLLSGRDWGKLPLYFIENRGQLDSRVAYYVQGSNKVIFFTAEGLTFALNDLTPWPARPQAEQAGNASFPLGNREREGRWIARLTFVDASRIRPQGQNRTETVISYFKGPAAAWQTGIATYAQVRYAELWPGIDLVYSGTVNRLKYEFTVQPGADPHQIRLAYHGAAVRLRGAALEVRTPAGSFQDDAPAAYQDVNGQRVPVAVRYAPVGAASYGFELGAYDPTLPLVIDPALLIYCGYIGGAKTDRGRAIAVDAAGNAYITGETASTETSFPAAIGPDLTYNGVYLDAFVAKVKADGTGLVYAGYIGGSGDDIGNGIAVDQAGNAYVFGDTGSSEDTFPVKIGPDLSYNGRRDAFVAKVTADGTGLAYAGYIGGDDEEIGRGIAVDAAGSAYVTGFTHSAEPTFPVVVGPDLTFGDGWYDAFVAKVKADGAGLVYSGFIGGDGGDRGHSIAVDTAGNAYIAGYTYSQASNPTLPVKIGPDLTFNGEGDAFVAKVQADGADLIYAGYIGGAKDDGAHGIALDPQGNAYVTGWALSTEATFPEVVGPDLTHNGGTNDVMVAKVKADGTGLEYCGYIGGSKWDEAWSIAVSAAGSATLTGWTKSDEATFPVTEGPDLTYNGNADAFVAQVQADGTALAYAGYIGGADDDKGYGVAADPAGNVYITGETASSEATFPVSTGPDRTYNRGTGDAFVTKVTDFTPRVKLYLPLIWRHPT